MLVSHESISACTAVISPPYGAVSTTRYNMPPSTGFSEPPLTKSGNDSALALVSVFFMVKVTVYSSPS